MNHEHWEIDSICPKCEHKQHIKIPVGETIMTVVCTAHGCGKSYTHMVDHPQIVED